MSDRLGMLKASVVALVVSVLVWIWAERESLATRTTEDIQVTFVAGAVNDLVVRPVSPAWTGTVRIKLEGSVGAVDRAVSQIGRSVRLSPALKGMPREPSALTEVDLRIPIADLPDLADLSGVVAEVTPAKVSVSAERMVNRTLPVRVVLGSGGAGRTLPIDGEPVATPPSVEIRLPEAAAAGLGPESRALAVVAEADLSRLRMDGPQTVTAAVRPPEGLPAGASVSVKPDTVSVTIRLRQTIESAKLSTVPVWFSLPPTEDGSKWTIEVVDKFLTDVTVSGPSEEVQRVRSGQVPVKAMVEFGSDELARVSADRDGTTKPVIFMGLPPGVTATVANGAVRVRVSKRP